MDQSISSARVGGERTAIEVQLSPTGARAEAMTLNGREFPLSALGGGFHAYDPGSQETIEFSDGRLDRSANQEVVFSCEQSGLLLTARFTSGESFLRVEGELENLKDGERGIVLRYVLPADTTRADWLFSGEPDSPVGLSDSVSEETHVYPIATLCRTGGDGAMGVAMAIPPMNPCVFGMAGGPEGLGTTFYLGLSPEQSRFPRKAPFTFIIYPVDPAWGFRDALRQYYGFHLEYYTPRVPKEGLWMFMMEGRTPENIEHYGFNETLMGRPSAEADIARDEAHRVLTFPYTIVGQREIKFLDVLPGNYEQAMHAFAEWDPPARDEETQAVQTSMRDTLVKVEVETCACMTAQGRYVLINRNTPWGGKSVTFTVNPNPDLAPEGRSVGRDVLELAEQWIERFPQIDGIYVDSLGANWPGVFNYRSDHFRFARYPLTLDCEGRVTLQNVLSHYEFLEALRERLRSQNRFLFGNGIYCYKPKRVEHYRAERLGRFFLSSLLDIAGAELGVWQSPETMKFCRACMGKKPFVTLNYKWENRTQVERCLNRALCYAVFTTNSTNIDSEVAYHDSPDGYARDREVLEWFVPKVRMLSRAGWEPVTHARVQEAKVNCERYGSGHTVYFSLFNDANQAEECVLEIDLEALALDRETLTYAEVARGAELQVIEGKGKAQVQLTLQPFRTAVVRLVVSFSQADEAERPKGSGGDEE